MALGKTHVVKVCLENYVHLIIGNRKIGKTTLVADIAEEYYGGLDKLLSIQIGNEDGYSAIDGLVYENPRNWVEFVEIIDELIQNADDNDFKMISIDTCDQLIEIAEKETIRLSRVETGKVCKSINDCFGGYGKRKRKIIKNNQ